jgi:signal transduction histidine kinase
VLGMISAIRWPRSTRAWRCAGTHGIRQQAKSTVSLVRKSVKRMSELVDNVLDFARGRLGSGITVTKSTAIPLEPALQHVVDEMKSSSIGHAITAELDLRRPVNCDVSRIGQMLSNLIANAISHGEKDGLVWVWPAAVIGAPLSPAVREMMVPACRTPGHQRYRPSNA